MLTTFDPQQAWHFYRQMRRIRVFEERVGELFMRGGTAGSMLHLSIGEESAAVGVGEAMRQGDGFTTHHRGHGIFLARGADPKRMMAEIGGKAEGYCRGKGGSMHIADRKLGHLGANAIVGGGITHVVGAGLSYQLQQTGQVAVAFFGDGAMQQGGLYESMNLAALWKLPVIFVCINNEYGMGTRLDQASASLEFARRAETFGLEGREVDGLEVIQIYRIARVLLEGARQGRPAFLKINCYRFFGHARMDKSPYRKEEEEESGRKKDALEHLRQLMTREEWATATGFEETDNEVGVEMDEAMDYALKTADPELPQRFEDVFSRETPQPIPVDDRIRKTMLSPVLAGSQ